MRSQCEKPGQENVDGTKFLAVDDHTVAGRHWRLRGSQRTQSRGRRLGWTRSTEALVVGS